MILKNKLTAKAAFFTPVYVFIVVKSGAGKAVKMMDVWITYPAVALPIYTMHNLLVCFVIVNLKDQTVSTCST